MAKKRPRDRCSGCGKKTRIWNAASWRGQWAYGYPNQKFCWSCWTSKKLYKVLGYSWHLYHYGDDGISLDAQQLLGDRQRPAAPEALIRENKSKRRNDKDRRPGRRHAHLSRMSVR